VTKIRWLTLIPCEHAYSSPITLYSSIVFDFLQMQPFVLISILSSQQHFNMTIDTVLPKDRILGHLRNILKKQNMQMSMESSIPRMSIKSY